ncbi:MAG: hypothetical protein HY901_09275 [Deltaproteobacteria bacterium]|nr:hypothetical protein [Deltaproteobacteria bacterium]
MSSLRLPPLVVATLSILFATCRAPAPLAAPDAATPSLVAPAQPPRPRFEVGWDPATGRGDVRQFLASGDIARTCFHCGYAGYTGGLLVGNLNSSGLGFYPREPIRGFRSINVLCATDESLWDLDERAEYSYGWSENYGTGDDGRRLEYVRGRILEGGPDSVVLQSENAGGCFRVSKVATARADAVWWIVATRITNRCERPARFHFFTGDDPWLGRYQSSDGDVGWTPEGLLEHEAELVPFTEGGIYDLGNRALGQSPEAFSNQASFFQVDPGSPPPDRAFLANRFAHTLSEIDPHHVLTNRSMIALNLGWTDRTLAPGASLTVALAMGLAVTGEPGTVPRSPPISDEDWSVWRRYLPEGPVAERLEFAAEEVTLDLEPDRVRVEGVYHLRNAGSASSTTLVRYPVFVASGQLAPRSVEIDGRETPVRLIAGRPTAELTISVAPHALTRFRVRYEQQLAAHRAGYLVTTAREWPSPIARAIFTIRRPVRLGPVKVSFPIAHSRREGDRSVDVVVMRDFSPDRELLVEW